VLKQRAVPTCYAMMDRQIRQRETGDRKAGQKVQGGCAYPWHYTEVSGQSHAAASIFRY